MLTSENTLAKTNIQLLSRRIPLESLQGAYFIADLMEDYVERYAKFFSRYAAIFLWGPALSSGEDV